MWDGRVVTLSVRYFLGCVALCCPPRRADCTFVGGVRGRRCRDVGAVWRWLFSGAGVGVVVGVGGEGCGRLRGGVGWCGGVGNGQWGVGVGVTVLARYFLVCGDGKEA